MKTLRMMMLSMVALGGTVVPAIASAGEPAAQVATTPAPAKAQALSTTETQSLAQREEKSKDLDKYEGGQVVIAISTVGAIVLAVILILVLL